MAETLYGGSDGGWKRKVVVVTLAPLAQGLFFQRDITHMSRRDA